MEPTTHLSPDPSANISQRIRYDSSGPTYYDGTSVLISTPLSVTTSQPITIRPSNRGGHSAQQYIRSYTDPLPEFGTVFGQSTGPQTTTDISLRRFSGANPMSPPLTQSQHLPYPQMERSISEPLLQYQRRVPEYPSRTGSNNRGRPFSRHHSRRQPTTRERREQLENELTAQEITHYELDHRYRYLYSVTQYFRRRLRDSGFTENQLDQILAQMASRYNPRDGHN